MKRILNRLGSNGPVVAICLFLVLRGVTVMASLPEPVEYIIAIACVALMAISLVYSVSGAARSKKDPDQ